MEPGWRVADESDGPAIVGCHQRSWRAAYRGDLPPERLEAEAKQRRSFDWFGGVAEGESTVLVADAGDGVTGVVKADLVLPAPRDLPEITMLYVDPDAWGTGVAATLLREGLGWIGERGHRAVRVRVVEHRGRARRFYEREGFVLDPSIEPAHGLFPLISYRRDLP